MTPSTGTDGRADGRARAVRALLFDRDGTLLVDVPYNAEAWRVRAAPGAVEALQLARARGLLLGVVTNQSGIARGMITPDQLARVHERMEAVLGGLDTIQWCPHLPTDGCDCRKPSPGLVQRAAAALGVRPDECVVIGDRHTDVLAGRAAGAAAIRIGTREHPDVLAAVRAVVSAEQHDQGHHDDDQRDPEDERHLTAPSASAQPQAARGA